ncbi:MAG: hypothetical protein JO170_25010 [Verrucomicrobia bacterium]|nr:hypothetical protein [Verrucomicrobiota bacterium]
MNPGAVILDDWRYRSREEELEAARWYLCGRLSLQTRLDSGSFGNAVYSYEWLRHVAVLWKGPRADLDLATSLNPAISEIWRSEGFPDRPFPMLSADTQSKIKCWFEAEWPAAMIEDAQALQQRGVFEKFIKLAAEPGAKPEVPLGPGAVAIVLTLLDSEGIEAVLKSVERLLKERSGSSSSKRGRQSAGRRKSLNPLYKLKDLAGARVFALLGYDARAANQWAYDNQPRDPKTNRRIPWFDQKGPRTKSQPLHRNRRDWLLVINRFSQKLSSVRGFTIEPL